MRKNRRGGGILVPRTLDVFLFHTYWFVGSDGWHVAGARILGTCKVR